MEVEQEYLEYISADQVDGLRGLHETDEHWELRREFIMTHKTNFPLCRLLSLSQTYCNIEILGCSYSDQIMKLIAELTAEMGQARRERQQQGHLQRHMVNASSVAEKKIRDRTRGNQDSSHQPRVVYGPPVTSGPRVTYGPPVSASSSGDRAGAPQGRYGGVRTYDTGRTQ